jgi:hypothetical protein
VSRGTLYVALLVASVSAAPLAAQAVPDSSQAARTYMGYRRSPTFRFDPFRHSFNPAWGFIVGVGAAAVNNTITLDDEEAVRYLNSKDSLTAGDVVDMLGLVPTGQGLNATVTGGGSFYLGGPMGSRLSLGFEAMGDGFASVQLSDSAVALLRDGNSSRPSFSLGDSRGSGLVTASAGAHLLVKLGPIGSIDGVRIVLGGGYRYVRPVVYGYGYSTITNGGRIALTSDSVVAKVGIESDVTVDPETTVKNGSGNALDFLIRAEWPTAGLALEAMVANIGSVSVPGVERRTLNLDIATTSIAALREKHFRPVQGDSVSILDTLTLRVKDTTVVTVDLPRVVRFTASEWANSILQLDVSATLPITGAFAAPLAVDVGTTWRLIRTIPLRAGLVLGGGQGIGYTGGIGIEGRVFYLQLSGQSLGGWGRQAKGGGARVEWGLFF